MSGLTVDEQGVVDALVEATNAFCALPTMHESDKDEFINAIHQAQALLALRIVRRDYPDYWTSITSGL